MTDGEKEKREKNKERKKESASNINFLCPELFNIDAAFKQD